MVTIVFPRTQFLVQKVTLDELKRKVPRTQGKRLHV